MGCGAGKARYAPDGGASAPIPATQNSPEERDAGKDCVESGANPAVHTGSTATPETGIVVQSATATSGVEPAVIDGPSQALLDINGCAGPEEPAHASEGSPAPPAAIDEGLAPAAPVPVPSKLDAEEYAEVAKVASQGMKRRSGVSAEIKTQADIDSWKCPFFEKSDHARQGIKAIITRSAKLQMLFGSLSTSSLDQAIGAMSMREVAVGEVVIRQGEDGDAFYIVEEGGFDIFVRRGHSQGDGGKVATFGAGTCFGELALMYNAPRAATVIAIQPGRLWSLQREPFQMLLITGQTVVKAQYEDFLSLVKLLNPLTRLEINELGSALEEPVSYEADEVIHEAGKDEDGLVFMLESGTAETVLEGSDGPRVMKSFVEVGDFFGEWLAGCGLPPGARIIATGKGCTVHVLPAAVIQRHFVPILDVLKAGLEAYPPYEAVAPHSTV
mmetsp:Transcript_47779/g.108887  ORF Transcript_47779/g.108887 Transcript_47779/m.108887 type:complete len:443 (+) Transcript_47779:49-1377(+)